jgi:nucleoside-diphosphate-sugar epimerase
VPGTDAVLVAGAGGFVGAEIVRALVGRGASVHALVRPSTDLSRLAELVDRITLHRVDAADRAGVEKCLEAVHPRALVNAMRTRPDRAERLALVRDNVEAAVNLLAAAGRSGCTRFLQLGSSTEYEARRGRLDESTPLRPASLQGATKAAASLVCRELAAELGVDLVVLWPFSVYGPWDEPGHLIPAAIAAALDGRELVLAPRGRRDWTFVSDVAEACLLALDSGIGGVELNLGTGSDWSNDEVVAAVARLSGAQIRVRIDESAARPWDRDDWRADPSRARELLGWRARHDLESGLEETIAWERARR